MANIAIFRINYKSDFILTLNSDAGWMTPFCIKFWTGAPSQAYFVGYDGTTYTNCAPVDGEPTKLLVQFDDHHLPIGDLKFQIGYHFTVADFPTTVEDEVINQAAVIIDQDGTPMQVMLDLNGETAPEIQFSLPAYANEAQRIANEEQRIAAEAIRIVNEESRIAAETIRQQNEVRRIAQETARVNEFATLKSQSQAATRDANDAATLANQKAQLAADKAALADDAATLANAKAQLAADKAALADAAATLANDKAALAQQKAEYAQTQGDYAKAQGDYAKEQSEIAEEDHERAEVDHTRSESDHATAGSDHTQAGTDHTRAESDHATASADHTQAGQDHTRAESDHAQATSDHTQAGTDHTRAESDHDTASADHTRAESDHTRAESDHAAVEVYVDSLGAFDISAYHATGGVLAKYADLTAALGTNGANIPDALRKGGMSVKFVHTSDNKYVEYNYLPDDATTVARFTNIANWQCLDTNPLYRDVEGEFMKELSWSSGYVNYSGKIYPSANSVFSQPFLLRKGERVTVTTNNDSVAIISTTDSDSIAINDTITPIQTTSSTPQVETHVYTAPADMKIVLCVTASNYTLSFFNTRSFVGMRDSMDDEPTAGSDNLVKSGGITNVYGKYVENPEFIRVYIERNNKIVWAIKKDGDIYFGAGVPKQIVYWFEPLLNEKVDKEEGKSLIDAGVSESMVVIEDRENRKELRIDSENNVISYRDEQGILHEMVGISSNSIYIKGRDVAKDMKKIEEQENYNTNAIEDINQDIQEIRTILYNSPYNKGHAYGVVPDIIYLGNTERDYSWGDRDTTTAQVLSQFDTLVDNDYVTSEIIGYGTDNQPIKVYKFNPPTIQSPTNYIKGVPTVMITCGTHGFEKNSAYGWFYLMKDIIENGNDNELLRYFKRNVRFYIVPVVCSSAWDSYSYYNSNNVNINLNYSNGWRQQEHSGNAPFDQPESAAIRDFLLAHKSEIDFFIDNHTTGGTVVSDNRHINWCDSTGCGNESDVYYNTIKNVIYTHTLNITNIVNELFPNNLKQDESKNCSFITYNKTPYEGWTDAYAISQNIIGMCFEVCPGFPVNDTAYSSLSKRAITIMQASIIGHFCYHYSKYFKI